MIDGIGKDAEIVTNDKGGKQSKAIGAFYLVDPIFLYGFFEKYFYFANPIIRYMVGEIDKDTMTFEIVNKEAEALVKIAKTLEEGVAKYPMNNWRLIPEEDHLNHALIHLYALEQGDTQDDHLGHFLTRIMMAYATKKSFKATNYTEYVRDETD